MVACRYEDDSGLIQCCVNVVVAGHILLNCIFFMSEGDFSMWLAAVTVVAASNIISGNAILPGKLVLSFQLSFEVFVVVVKSVSQVFHCC
jgi:hypothetical protein